MRMNRRRYKRILVAVSILRIATLVLMAAGMFTVIGAVGTDDFYTMELHQVYDTRKTVITGLIGILMQLPYPILFGDWDQE